MPAGFPFNTNQFMADYKAAWDAGYKVWGKDEVAHTNAESAWAMYEGLGQTSDHYLIMGNGMKVWERDTLLKHGVSASTVNESVLDIISEGVREYSVATKTELVDFFEARADKVNPAQEQDYETWKYNQDKKSDKKYRNVNYEESLVEKLNARSVENSNLREGPDMVTTDFFRKGRVLGEREWDPSMNDAWLLSAIHNSYEIYYINENGHENSDSKIGPNGVLYSSFLRVTGRELLGLHLFGYRSSTDPIEKGSPNGAVFVPTVAAEHENASFVNYRNYIDRLEESGQVRDRIQQVRDEMFVR